MSTRLLREFTRVVPTCTPTTSLSALLELVERCDCEEVIVVEERQPVGLVWGRKLFSWLLSQGSSQLSRSLLTLYPALVESITTISADLEVGQCLAQLNAPHASVLAVVDAEGYLLGILNHLELLKATLAQERPLPQPVALNPGHSSGELPAGTVQSLLQLLKQLPLPAMLQTSSGQAILQNPTWQQQVGELQNPEGIRQEAGVLLELGTAYTPSQPVYPGTPAPKSAVGICEIGAEPNTCICTCPMRDGLERTWQFTRIPLHFVAYLEPPTVAQAGGLAAHSLWGLPQFQLASLGSADAELPQATLPNLQPSISTEDLWLVLAQDRTEQQQVARELVAKNADLMQLNRFKDEFLSCISHELKTPLTAVLGLSSLLGEQTLGTLNERQTRYVRLIHQSGRHLMTIVNDILDLTRIETGQLNLDLVPLEIALVCDRAYHQLRRSQEEETALVARPPFTLEIDPQVTNLVADELRLRQMLINLLSNAYKFTGPEGRIGLKVNYWEGWVAFTVWDTGIGIPPDKQHLIFQKFQQLENPLTRRFEGTGLGLVLTQRLARLHGGDITFFSKEGEGSQFTLLLPPQPPNYQPLFQPNFPLEELPSRGLPPPQPLTYGPPAASNRLVLIVEAVPQFIEELHQQLTGMAYRVAIARSGTEALEKARRLQPCLIFLNPVLPMLSGWDVLTLLKSSAATRDIPVVVTATAGEQERANRYQADGVLALPIQLPALTQSLSRLAHHPATAASIPPAVTILWLRSQGNHPAELEGTAPLQADISSLLHAHHHRILEVDDLEQAELLAQVWKPQMVLLDVSPPDPVNYIQDLHQHSFLASLPLITLNREITQAANQIPGLLVFPCLVSPGTKLATTEGQPEVSALLQVIQVAAGINWKPCILVADLAMLTDSLGYSGLDSNLTSPITLESTPSPLSQAATNPSNAEPSGGMTQAYWQSQADWLQAWLQYLQTADFRSVIGYSWGEVLQQIHYQTVDLLLICLRHPPLHPDMAEEIQATQQKALQALQQLPNKPPILVLNYQLSLQSELEQTLGAIATQILPASLSMQELLNYISRILSQ